MKVWILLLLVSVVPLISGRSFSSQSMAVALRSEKLVRKYISCVLEEGRCDKYGMEIKGKKKDTIVLS